MVFCVWLLSLNTGFSDSSHLAAASYRLSFHSRIIFRRTAVCATLGLPVQPLVGIWGFPHSFTGNNAAWTPLCAMLPEHLFLIWVCALEGTCWSCAHSSLRNCPTATSVAVPLCSLTSRVRGPRFSTPFQTCYSLIGLLYFWFYLFIIDSHLWPNFVHCWQE